MSTTVHQSYAICCRAGRCLHSLDWTDTWMHHAQANKPALWACCAKLSWQHIKAYQIREWQHVFFFCLIPHARLEEYYTTFTSQREFTILWQSEVWFWLRQLNMRQPGKVGSHRVHLRAEKVQTEQRKTVHLSDNFWGRRQDLHLVIFNILNGSGNWWGIRFNLPPRYPTCKFTWTQTKKVWTGGECFHVYLVCPLLKRVR